MDKELLDKLGITFEGEINEEEAKGLILQKIDEKDKRIESLEAERDSLSKDKEELTSSVEGYKTREENLSKDLSETKEKLVSSESKLSQITELYKEQFTKAPEEKTVKKEEINEKVKFDILSELISSE